MTHALDIVQDIMYAVFSEKKKIINKIAFGREINLSVIRRDLNHLTKSCSEAIFPTLTQTAS